MPFIIIRCAGPLAKMLLGAKQRGRPRIVSRIIVEEYVALWVFPTCSTAMFCHLGQYTEICCRYLVMWPKCNRSTVCQFQGSWRLFVNAAIEPPHMLCVFAFLAPNSILASGTVLTRRHWEKKHARPKILARSACLHLQPTGVRMVTTLPTESQRYRESGVIH